MREITYLQAISEAIDEEMARDKSVFVMGEDVRKWGSPMGELRGTRRQVRRGPRPRYRHLRDRHGRGRRRGRRDRVTAHRPNDVLRVPRRLHVGPALRADQDPLYDRCQDQISGYLPELQRRRALRRRRTF